VDAQVRTSEDICAPDPLEQKQNVTPSKVIPAMMDARDNLAFYPFVVAGSRARVCSRRGSYRLARHAAKFGPEISLRDLTDRFSYDCPWRARSGPSAASQAAASGPRPPDLPPELVKLRRVKND
jgi:hypothetical protein